jgi:CBS domain-containing protein
LVTDVDGRLLGIVSDRDVGRCFGPAGRPDEATLAAIRTEEIMSRDLITIDADAPLTAAIDLMYGQGVSCLPVVSGDRLVGIITTTDLLRLLRRVLVQ